jgi:hypothetical protein
MAGSVPCQQGGLGGGWPSSLKDVPPFVDSEKPRKFGLRGVGYEYRPVTL